jgi:hypothetical protein
MEAVPPDSPLTIEEILLRLKWRITYKDDCVCVLDNPADPKSRPVCIPQKANPVDPEIQQQIIFEAKLNAFHYLPLRAAVIADRRP